MAIMRIYYTLRVTIEDMHQKSDFKQPELKGKRKVFVTHFNNHKTLPPVLKYRPYFFVNEEPVLLKRNETLTMQGSSTEKNHLCEVYVTLDKLFYD
mmetsp:Transcript_38746/g.28637  ORF Transcript_38746/g.28637 Transcript_38746/m.28637 type:complete len:96 (-) Transcript_38746:345-632(-)